MDVVGVGALNLDLLYEVRELKLGHLRLAPGEKAVGGEMDPDLAMHYLGSAGRLRARSGGGSAANTVYALSRMGFSTGMLGTVGEDDDGRLVIEAMGGVDLSHLARRGKTGVCLALLAEGDRSLVIYPNANDEFEPSGEDLEYADGAKVVHMSSFVAERALQAQVRLVDALGDRVTLSFAPGELYARKGARRLGPLLERADLLFLSEGEAEMMMRTDWESACRRLLEIGPDIVVCTRGARGSEVFTEDERVPTEAVRTEVVDATGAGDVYAAGFLAGTLQGWSLADCSGFASRAAARSIAYYGREGYPVRPDLMAFAKGMATERGAR